MEGGLMWYVMFEGVWLIGISIFDVRERRIPLWVLLLGGAGTAIYCVLTGNPVWQSRGELLAACLPGIILLVMSAVKKAGWADGVVLLLLGVTNEHIMPLFCISLCLAALAGIALLLLHKAGKDTALPFLPFLTVAWVAGRLAL